MKSCYFSGKNHKSEILSESTQGHLESFTGQFLN